MTLDFGKIVRAALGNNPAPYMNLNIPHGIMNELKRLGGKVEDLQWRYLPRANGMQEELFQEWYPDDSQAKYNLMRQYYNM